MSGADVAEIFNLQKVLDDPRFEGFGLDTLPSLLGRENINDDMYPAYRHSEVGRNWRPVRLAKLWLPPQVEGRVQPFNDCPCVNLSYPAFSRRACDALRDLLEPNGELLPLDSDAGEYYFYNITTVIDALDLKKSKGAFFDSGIAIGDLMDYFWFHPAKLAGATIFRVPDVPACALVTRTFIDRVHEAGLNGFDFIKLWPLPKGSNWRIEDKKLKKKQFSIRKEMKAQTLVVAFALSGKKPSAAEKKSLAKLEDDLDAQLAVRSLDAPFFGVYEGHEIQEGEYRMFLRCPDADALAAKLLPWLQSIVWSSEVHAMKRYGDMRDPNAREKILDLSRAPAAPQKKASRAPAKKAPHKTAKRPRRPKD